MTHPLRIAIVHYHLRRGGVTSVIRHQTAALAAREASVVVLAGKGPSDVPWFKAVPGLDYASTPIKDAKILVRELKREARAVLGSAPDVWHFHNHALGKNPALTAAVHHLAETGERLLLHIHDFAEDGRPRNYQHLLRSIGEQDPGRLTALMYPQAMHVHYAVLSRRDQNILLAAGFAPQQVHVLPNPMPLPPDPLPPPSAGPPPFFLYPTRGLRRKNLGELLLWAAASGGERFGATLAPTGASDLHPYLQWKQLALKLRLPVDFEIGLHPSTSFEALMRDAAAIMTTSVAEGFGLAFLEPWSFGRPLVGRNLPELTGEFSDKGLCLDSLYDHLWIPEEWVGLKPLRKRLQSQLEVSWKAYGQSLPPDALEKAMESMTRDACLDFGHLDETLQAGVIRKLAASRTLRTHLAPRHPWLSFPTPDVISGNRKLIKKHFSLESYADRLLNIYQRLQNSKTGKVGSLSHKILLAAFLDPHRFLLLRT